MRHYKESLRDPFFYICLIAIFDSFRFYTDLPHFISALPIYQDVWFSSELFLIIKKPLVFLTLSCCALGTLSFFFTNRKRLSYQLLFWGYFLGSFIHFHYHKFYHRSHLLIYCLFILAFLWTPSSRTACRRLIQKLTLLIYGMTGTWKAYYILKNYLIVRNFEFLTEVLPRHIAHFFLVDYEYNTLGIWLFNSPHLSSVLFIVIVLVQLSSFLVINRPELYRVWGCAILSFHCGVYVFLNILFWQMILIVFVFFILFGNKERIEHIQRDAI